MKGIVETIDKLSSGLWKIEVPSHGHCSFWIYRHGAWLFFNTDPQYNPERTWKKEDEPDLICWDLFEESDMLEFYILTGENIFTSRRLCSGNGSTEEIEITI